MYIVLVYKLHWFGLEANLSRGFCLQKWRQVSQQALHLENGRRALNFTFSYEFTVSSLFHLLSHPMGGGYNLYSQKPMHLESSLQSVNFFVRINVQEISPSTKFHMNSMTIDIRCSKHLVINR